MPGPTRHNGEWRSLVAHPAGGRAVAGSNPVSPISTPVRLRPDRESPARLRIGFDTRARTAADSAVPRTRPSPLPATGTTMVVMGHDHEHGDGLHEDLVKLASRRDALRIFGVGVPAPIVSTLGASRSLSATPTAQVPTETPVPYPGDGSNG